jgi:predicted nucleotidyltransferase
LDEVLSRLQQHELVVAILLMGSTGEGSLTPSSDYDLCLVLSELPAPAKLVTTWINGRLAEVYITTADAVRRASAEPEKWVAGSEEEALIRWLRSGRVIFDRAGLMEIGQAKARRAPIAVPHESSKYWAWWGIGYNVAHMRRYAASEDATSRAAAQVRLLWSVFQVFAHYFTIREIPWRGEKEAINYLTSNDPAFLDLLNQCIDEHDIQHKAFLYEELAKMTLAPVGGLWTSGQTTVELGPGFGTGDTAKHDEPGISAEAALDFWHQLTRDTTR